MELLLHEKLAPLTTTIAFFHKADVEVVALALREAHSKDETRFNRGTQVVLRRISGNLSDVLQTLLPLTNVELRRHLVVATEGDGVAYFNNSWRGDLGSVDGYLPPMIQSSCTTIGVEPRTLVRQSNGWTVGRYGMCTFGMYNTQGKTVRYIGVLGTDNGFDFVSVGEPQPFEDVQAYNRRSKKERITFEMLKQYCEALGLRPFDEDFYKPERAILIEKQGTANPQVQTFDLVTAWKDFQPST